MPVIQNRRSLLSHGNSRLRRAALNIIEAALDEADPYRAVHRLVRISGDQLRIGRLRFALPPDRRIFLLGGGKASFPIARALEDLLGDRIEDGVVVCKYGQQGRLAHARLFLAAHPIPDQAGLAAAREALALARRTRPGDLVFGCVTGGSSALMPYPVNGISLRHKQNVNQLLLTCGANIIEINAVRKHLSRIKGGRLAQALHPRAELINLTVSDVIGDPLDYITDPTVPDTSTLQDACRTLDKYALWSRVPAAVRRYFKSADESAETPKEKDLAGRKRHDFILVPSNAVCEAAAYQARRLGFRTMILSTMLEGESRSLGGTFAAIAREIDLNHRPLKRPCAIVGGGETTVTISGRAGTGGPNQEFALAAALGIEALADIVVAGLDSDGTDGPTDIAGALVDSGTHARGRQAGLELFDALMKHDVTPALTRLQDIIVTGATGTNVNDLKLMLLGPAGEGHKNFEL